MYGILAACLYLSVSTGLLMAQGPSILTGGVVNVASYQPAALPGSAIAQGAMFVVFGSNLGPATLVQAGAFPIPTTLGGTSISVTSGGTTLAAPIFYTSASQVVAILPSSTPTGTARLTVTYNGQTSSFGFFQVAVSSFGIFTGNYGSGPGAIVNSAGQVYGFTNAANPGETAVLYGTGLGPVSGNEAGGPLPGQLSAIPVQVWVGQQVASISYQGRSGCCAALDQISFVVPNVTGCRVPVAVQINNSVSNFASIAIAPAGSRTCSDPGGPDSTHLAAYLQNGVRVGAVTLSRSSSTLSIPNGGGTATINADSGAATFLKYPAASLNSAANPFGTSQTGACTVSWAQGSPGTTAAPDNLATTMDAGTAILVTGTAGSKNITRTKTDSGAITYSGSFSGSFPGGAPGGAPPAGGTPPGGGAPPPGGGTPPASTDFLNPGTFTIAGPGGSDIAAFTTSLTVSPPLTWTNQATITSVSRNAGQTVTWSGGDPAGTVYISGYSATGTDPNSYTATFTCAAKVSDGQFKIPPVVTLSLPVSATAQLGSADFPGGPQSVVLGGLSVGTKSAPVSFSASPLDIAFAVSSVSSQNTVSFQ